MSHKFDIMAAGHLCIDVIPSIPATGAASISELMRPGKLLDVGPAIMSTGGSVSNTGIALIRLGNRVCFCARVGDDEFGRLTLDCLKRSGSTAGIRVVAGAASSYTVVIAPPGIDRIFMHNPGTNNEFCVADIDRELVSGCRHFHFGYPPLMRSMFTDNGSELLRIFKMAKAAGATTSCDMALPDPNSPAGKADWSRILRELLPYVDIFLPSIEEAFYMLEPETFLRRKAELGGAELIEVMQPEQFSEMAEKILELGPRMTSLKAGKRGWYFRTAAENTFCSMGAARPGSPAAWSDRELWCPAFDTQNIASATGSGDSSIAGFLTAFLNGLSLEHSLKWAVCLGHQNVQVLDAVSGVKSAGETAAMLETGIPILDPELNSPAWFYDQAAGLWYGPADSRH